MKIIDNFDLFKSVLKFNSDDEFYFLQILIRGKDGHTEPGINGNNKNRLIKYYTITSVNHLSNIEDEVKTICDGLNARAYIHPTKRSFKDVADEMLRITTEEYLSKHTVGLKGAYSRACGISYITSDKKFVVDLDGDYAKRSQEIAEYIEQFCEPIGKIKTQYVVPTAHGIHLITTPFNTQKFSEYYNGIDVHKNNPTLLYFKSLI